MEHNKGMFNSTFGFLMASIGSAVGLGNLWGFPYKIGTGGGFAFLLIYLLMVIFVGYPLILGEIALGRKTQRAAIEAYRVADRRFTINGIFETIVPFLLICFYCTMGGYVIKYMIANLGDMFGAGWGTGRGDATEFFFTFIDSTPAIFFGMLFLFLTVVIVIGGVSGGIENFSKFAMPALFIMLVIVVIRSCTLPGAGEGLAFIFKPSLEPFKNGGWAKVLAMAGSQMFFSLSIASGCLIAYGSYLEKNSNLERNALIIPIADTSVAILAAMAVMPAVFATGLEPGAGPSLLFISLQAVFNSMGSFGPLFGFLFYALVFFAALTSSIGMMEGGVSAMMDAQTKKGKKASRIGMTMIMAVVALAGSTLVSADALNRAGFWNPLNALLGPEADKSWLDVFDLGAEGILMPLGGLLMAIMLGWTRKNYIADEVRLGSSYKSQAFVNMCYRYIAPIFMFLLLLVQVDSFIDFTDIF